MELTDGKAKFTLPEARWVVSERTLTEVFRKRVEVARRTVLAPLIEDIDWHTIADLPPGRNPTDWSAFVSMMRAESQLPRGETGQEQHVVEVDVSTGEIDELYLSAVIAHQSTRHDAMNFQDSTAEAYAMGSLLDPDSEGPDEPFEEEAFDSDMFELGVTSAIIAAIDRFRS